MWFQSSVAYSAGPVKPSSKALWNAWIAARTPASLVSLMAAPGANRIRLMTATTICFMMGSLLSQHYASFKVLLPRKWHGCRKRGARLTRSGGPRNFRWRVHVGQSAFEFRKADTCDRRLWVEAV